MNPYEDAYLRKRVGAIIERQRQGAIVIASYADGTGLPTRSDLPPIGRGEYPHDYTVGNCGYLNYDSALGAYIFTPKPGAALPKVLANYRPLTLAEAEIHAGKRLAVVQAGETRITFTGVPVWEPGYRLLQQLNEELARADAATLVWRLTDAEDGLDKPSRLFARAAPQLRNGQALAHVTGYAWDRNSSLVYAGAVGYKTSLESLRATLTAHKTLTLSHDGRDTYLTPLERYEHLWRALPEYTCHHSAFIARLALPGRWEPEDREAYVLVFTGAPDPKTETLRLFIERLKETLNVPLLDEWAAPLWEAACAVGMIQTLTTAGDCLCGYRLDLSEDWQTLVTGLLQENAITL